MINDSGVTVFLVFWPFWALFKALVKLGIRTCDPLLGQTPYFYQKLNLRSPLIYILKIFCRRPPVPVASLSPRSFHWTSNKRHILPFIGLQSASSSSSSLIDDPLPSPSSNTNITTIIDGEDVGIKDIVIIIIVIIGITNITMIVIIIIVIDHPLKGTCSYLLRCYRSALWLSQLLPKYFGTENNSEGAACSCHGRSHPETDY